MQNLKKNAENIVDLISREREPHIPITSIFFGDRLKCKFSFYLISTFFCCFKPKDQNIYIFLKTINKFFELRIRKKYILESVKEINSFKDVLGFTISFLENNNCFVYNLLDINTILSFYSKSYITNIQTFKDLRKLNVYASKLFLYTEAIPRCHLTIEEFKRIFGVQNIKYYDNFKNFTSKIVKPSLQSINNLGICNISLVYKRTESLKVNHILIDRN